MIIIWADRLAALTAMQYTLLGVLLMVAAAGTVICIKLVEDNNDDA